MPLALRLRLPVCAGGASGVQGCSRIDGGPKKRKGDASIVVARDGDEGKRPRALRTQIVRQTSRGRVGLRRRSSSQAGGR
ncbi:hypothetical protein B0H14DRAFT_2721766 [Mycena olivaceomarginata]|nr:hypothetical protein B0H14DRAFT_2721766 [Mycena olivaceomarginata]